MEPNERRTNEWRKGSLYRDREKSKANVEKRSALGPSHGTWYWNYQGAFICSTSTLHRNESLIIIPKAKSILAVTIDSRMEIANLGLTSQSQVNRLISAFHPVND
jgi:hypothetical protein